MKDVSRFELLSGLNDDLVSEAALPDVEAKPAPRRRRFGDLMNDPRVAVVSSVTVALAVLFAIVAAGRMAPTPGDPSYKPPHGLASGDRPGTTQMGWNDETDPSEDGRVVIVETSEDDELTIMSEGAQINPIGYAVWYSYQSIQNGELVTDEGDLGGGAVGRLNQLFAHLPVLRTTGKSYTIYRPSNMVIHEIRLFEVRTEGGQRTFAEISLPADAEAALDVAFTGREGEYVVVLDATLDKVIEPDQRWGKERAEYTLRLTVTDTEADTTPSMEVQNLCVHGTNFSVIPKEYLVSHVVAIPNEEGVLTNILFKATGPKIVFGELPVVQAEEYDIYAITEPQDGSYIQSMRILRVEDSEGTSVTPIFDSLFGPWTTRLSSLEEGEYIVVLRTLFYNVSHKGWHEEIYYDHAFRLQVSENEPEDNEHPTNMAVMAGYKVVAPRKYTIQYEATLRGEDGQMMDIRETGDSWVSEPWESIENLPYLTARWGANYSLSCHEDNSLQKVEVYRIGYMDGPTLSSVSCSNSQWSWSQWLSRLDSGDYLVVMHTSMHQVISEDEYIKAECEYVFRLGITDIDADTEAGDVEGGDDPLPEPDVDDVLDNAQPADPPIPDGSVKVGETALPTLLDEYGTNQRIITRVTVFRNSANPYIHYLHAEALSLDGHVLATSTRAIHGFFVLLRHEDPYEGLLLATLDGRPVIGSSEPFCNVESVIEQWFCWSNLDAISGEFIGDVRPFTEEYGNLILSGNPDTMGKALSKRAAKYWDTLEDRMDKLGGAENYRVMVDFFTDPETPLVYSYEESQSVNAVGLDKLTPDTWTAFLNRMKAEFEYLS